LVATAGWFLDGGVEPPVDNVVMRFVELGVGDGGWELALPVLRELRPHLTAESLAAIYAEGYPQGLRFTAAASDEGEVLGVAGWRIIANTNAGRMLYVDDLVTAAAARSTGVGGALLAELAKRATDAGCTALELDSAVHRFDAHRFYLRERMAITAHHFGRKLEG
jgi:GNAT superfamily N-acetyltransferase